MDLLRKYFPELTDLQLHQYEALFSEYKNWNDKINVISRKDIDNLYLHHVLHSMSLIKVIQFTKGTRILDLGTGGGFPTIPLAIYFPNVFFDALDSTKKKLTVIDAIADSIGLRNIQTIHQRVEEHRGHYHFVVSRAVAAYSQLSQWSKPLISKQQISGRPNGLFCYKGIHIESEITPEEKRHVEKFPISDYFEEEYFKEKSIYYQAM